MSQERLAMPCRAFPGLDHGSLRSFTLFDNVPDGRALNVWSFIWIVAWTEVRPGRLTWVTCDRYVG